MYLRNVSLAFTIALCFFSKPSLASYLETQEEARPQTAKTQYLNAYLTAGWQLTAYTDDFNCFSLLFQSPDLAEYRFIYHGQESPGEIKLKNILKETSLYDQISTPILSGGKPYFTNKLLRVSSQTDTSFIDLEKSSDTDVFSWKIINKNIGTTSMCTDVTFDFIYSVSSNENKNGHLKYKYWDLTNKTPSSTFSKLPSTEANQLNIFESVHKYPYFIYSNLTERNTTEVMLFDSKSLKTRLLEEDGYLLETLDGAVVRRVLLGNGSTVHFNGTPLTFLCRKQFGMLSSGNQETRYIRWDVKCLNEGSALGDLINEKLNRYLTAYFAGQYRDSLLSPAISLWNPGEDTSFHESRREEYLKTMTDLDIISDTYPLDISFSHKDDELEVKSTYAISSIGTFELSCSLKMSLVEMYLFGSEGFQENPVQTDYCLPGKTEQGFPSFKLQAHTFNNLDIPIWRIQSPLYKGKLKSRKIPTVLYLRGGPFTVKNDPFDTYFRFLSDQGFAVFVPNYAGSTHTINSFVEAKGKCIDLTIRYLQGLVEQMLKLDDSLDTEKFAIVGDSYGGMIALQHAVGNSSLNNIGAVVSLSGPTDFMTLNDEKLHYDTLNEYLFAGDNEKAKTMSPITHAANLSIPTLIVQGRDDSRVAYEEVKAFVDCATGQIERAPLTFVSIDHAKHGFSTREQLNTYQMLVTQFLRHHLNYWDGPGVEIHREQLKGFDGALASAFASIEFGRDNLGLGHDGLSKQSEK